MPYVQSIEGCLDAAIGDAGLPAAVLESYLKELQPALTSLKASHEDGSARLLRIPEETNDIDQCRVALTRLLKGAADLHILGTGGSSLGGQTLAQLAGDTTIGLHFHDNLDPDLFRRAIDGADPASARFLVISKSGGTAETLSQAIVALTAVKARGRSEDLGDVFLGVSEEAKEGVFNGLRVLLEAHDIPILPHDEDVGGRFSAFTNVGLLPAMAVGLDAHGVRAGARGVVEAMLAARDPAQCPPAVGAAVSVGLARERGVCASVMMPYTGRLAAFSAWYAQLWAESLGKDGQGTIPVAALGPVDQHSMLQLLLGGPAHYLATIIRPAQAGTGPTIDPGLAEQAGAPYLAGRTIGDLVSAQQKAIADVFTVMKRPVRLIDVARIDEETLGALMMHFVLETIFAAHLLGVSPYGQPAVEKSKHLTRAYLEEAPA